MKTQIGTTSKGKSIKVEIEGLEKLNEILRNVPIQANEAVFKEMELITQDLKGKSQRLAPKDLGDLRGSAFAEVQRTMFLKIAGTVGFTEPYALRQHEEMDYHHTDGQAKYLETPYKENVSKYTSSIGKAIKGAVGG